ncbi:unnamed protein product [Linum tenue]|uniref:Peroxidase n=1 Tax=Linum tenue TaxID=586396 RepID=A0AAV0IEA2_9ROSI|nr:unnamed protein product [Linum tenue]
MIIQAAAAAPLFLLLLLLLFVAACNAQLRVGFYSETCPSAEETVRAAVKEAMHEDMSSAARLLRLSFHDCFVQGCDASILLEAEGGEAEAPGNAGVGGFEVIGAAKKRVESLCPGVVSCADIVMLAARDAVALSDGPDYELPTGRRDGRISSLALASHLPEVNDPIRVLKAKFHAKGLSEKDLVLLTAAHTLGTAACFLTSKRLYNFSGISPRFLPRLKSFCPLNSDFVRRIPLDWASEFEFDDHILRNVVTGFAVLASDAQLTEDRKTRQVLESYVGGGHATSSFGADFAEAMVKMGRIGVKTGSQGEIRKICGKVN